MIYYDIAPFPPPRLSLLEHDCSHKQDLLGSAIGSAIVPGGGPGI